MSFVSTCRPVPASTEAQFSRHQLPPAMRARLEQDAVRLMHLAPRPVAEALAYAVEHCPPETQSAIATMIRSFAAMSPTMVKRIGAHQLPPRPAAYDWSSGEPEPVWSRGQQR